MYPEKRFLVISVNFPVRADMYSDLTGSACLNTVTRYCPSRKKKKSENTIRRRENRKFPVIPTSEVPAERIFVL